MKKKSIIIAVTVVLLIIGLWLGGVIPKQIAKIYGSVYMKTNFPEMKLKYANVEWSKYHGDYLITFKDKENQQYGCVIGPKYFPICLGQGLFAIEETYKMNYKTNDTTID